MKHLQSALVGTLLLIASFASAHETTPFQDLLSPVLGESYKCGHPTKVNQGESYACLTSDRKSFTIVETKAQLWGKISVDFSGPETLPLFKFSKESEEFKTQLATFKEEVTLHVAGRIFADPKSNPKLVSEYGQEASAVNFGSKYLVYGDTSGVAWDVTMEAHFLKIDWQYSN